MKYLTLMAFLLLGLTACEKEETPNLECDGNCLFVLEKVEGEILRMNCFEQFAIQTNRGGEDIFGLPDDLDSSFEEEGMKVVFTAKYRGNVLEPNFPDPSFEPSTIYQIELIDISVD